MLLHIDCGLTLNHYYLLLYYLPFSENFQRLNYYSPPDGTLKQPVVYVLLSVIAWRFSNRGARLLSITLLSFSYSFFLLGHLAFFHAPRDSGESQDSRPIHHQSGLQTRSTSIDGGSNLRSVHIMCVSIASSS